MLDIVESAVLNECIVVPLVMQFPGVRSLVNYDATSTATWVVMKNEIEHRKAVIVKRIWRSKANGSRETVNELPTFISQIIYYMGQRPITPHTEKIMFNGSIPTHDSLCIVPCVWLMMRLESFVNVLIIDLDQVRGQLLLGPANMMSGRKWGLWWGCTVLTLLCHLVLINLETRFICSTSNEGSSSRLCKKSLMRMALEVHLLGHSFYSSLCLL